MENGFTQIPFLEIKTLKASRTNLKSLEGKIHLPAWQGFQSRKGAYNSIDRTGTSNGWVNLTVGEYQSSETLLTISTEQVNAYNFTIDQQNNIKENVLNALFSEYQKLRQEYGPDEDDEGMPNVTATSQFSKLIGLSAVHVLEVSKEGTAYVGYEFGCTWDPEHGLGVMTHRDRVIEVGAADTSFEAWIAERDVDPVKAEEELQKAKNSLPVQKKKPWWKVW